jgi:hypothetical protein
MPGLPACRAPTARETPYGCRGEGCRPAQGACRLGHRRRSAARTMSRRVPVGPRLHGSPGRLVNESDGRSGTAARTPARRTCSRRPRTCRLRTRRRRGRNRSSRRCSRRVGCARTGSARGSSARATRKARPARGPTPACRSPRPSGAARPSGAVPSWPSGEQPVPPRGGYGRSAHRRCRRPGSRVRRPTPTASGSPAVRQHRGVVGRV